MKSYCQIPCFCQGCVCCIQIFGNFTIHRVHSVNIYIAYARHLMTQYMKYNRDYYKHGNEIVHIDFCSYCACYYSLVSFINPISCHSQHPLNMPTKELHTYTPQAYIQSLLHLGIFNSCTFMDVLWYQKAQNDTGGYECNLRWQTNKWNSYFKSVEITYPLQNLKFVLMHKSHFRKVLYFIIITFGLHLADTTDIWMENCNSITLCFIQSESLFGKAV